jgi:NAD+ diphosphatase
MANIQMSPKEELLERFLDYASRGDLAKVSGMISHSSFLVNESGENGWTALMLAARNGHTDIVDNLLSNG